MKNKTFKLFILKSIAVLIFIIIVVVSYYFNQSILKTIFNLILYTSILANFYPPLHFNCTDNIDLTVDLQNNKTFQPIFLTKQNGITESINAKFIRCRDSGKITFIEFQVVKYSGLFRHGISHIRPDADCFAFKMNLFAPKKVLLPIDYFSQDLQGTLNDSTKGSTDIETIAFYGLAQRFLVFVTKIVCNNNKNIASTIINQGGSICNIKCIHSKT